MRVWLAGDESIHAPAQTLPAFISAYTSGGDGAIAIVHSTLDGKIVCCSSDDLTQLTGQPGQLHQLSYPVVRSTNIGANFKTIDGAPVRYNATPPLLKVMLEDLPADMEVVLDLARSIATPRRAFIERVMAIVVQSPPRKQWIYLIQDIADVEIIRRIVPEAAILLRASDCDRVVDSAVTRALAGVVLSFSDYLRLKPKLAAAAFSLGAIVEADAGVLDPPQYTELSTKPFVHAAVVRSVLLSESLHFERRLLCDEDFHGQEFDPDTWSLGYARANRYCHVYQNDGVHIDITPYNAPAMPPAPDDIERRLRRVEIQVLVALEDTPTYSGGGIGLRRGLVGDFSVDALVSSQQAVQASTVEIAVVNGDPARHFEPWAANGTPRFPQGPHDKHSFFDPHGAPPYVGTEHDENDGYRINWNASTDYDDNHYGSALGDGLLLDAWLRLERRGPYFASYYRPQASADASRWVCVGVVRNDALARRVFLRCAGKRWQKANPNGSGYLPVVPNHFVIRHIRAAVRRSVP
jgi:glycerophosphoryl diester phosphodiesterase